MLAPIAAVFVLLLAFAVFCRWLLANPRQDVAAGLVVRGFQIYGRVVHGLRATGLENIPDTRFPGPLLIVANHTAGIDPIVVQAFCPFEVRWLMARDMMIDAGKDFWDWAGVIGVDRGAQDASSVRVALRHLRSAAKQPEGFGAVGLFPEGGIERPPGQIMPFLPGVGAIIKKARCRVLPVLITGTPQVDPAWASLWHTSKTTVHFGEILDYTDSPLDPVGIANDLRHRLLERSGWRANNVPGPWDPNPAQTLEVLGIEPTPAELEAVARLQAERYQISSDAPIS
ncbi:MAG: lysophospholipid acyltransferase family protein [Planctomycetota bacterium]